MDPPLFSPGFFFESGGRDMVQETLVCAYFGSAKFTPRASVKTWLYAIAPNLSRDHVRRLIRQRLAVPIDVDRDAPAIEIADAGPLANEAAGKRDEFTLLQRTMDRLPHKLREALVVFSLEDKSQAPLPIF